MPFALRTVEPSRYDIVPGSLTCDDHTLVPVEITNRLVVTVLQQLKCLVRHADDVFCDLTEECHKVVERTDKIQDKVKSLTVAVENLNYREVPIPVGDLKVFCQKENGIDHFTARHGYDNLLLAPDTRPQCVKDLYNMASVNPVQIIRQCDAYRRDGVKGSMLFRQWPIFVKQPKSKTPDLSVRKLPLVVSFEKDYKPLKLRNIIIQRSDSGEKDEEDTKLDTAVVPIDTSGVAFQRMCSFRQSLRNVDEIEGEDISADNKSLKKKRRQTFSGVPQNIWKEICAFENSKLGGNKRNSIQDKLKSYSFDDLDAAPGGTKEEGELVKYLDTIEDRIEEREELEQSLSENKFLRLIPCRRSCSLPRSAKLHAHRTKNLTSRPLSKCEAKSETTLATLRGSVSALANKRCSSIGSTLSLHSSGSVASSRQSRASKRSSIVGGKIKSLLSGGPKPVKDTRPKSLDLDALDTDPEEQPLPASNLSRTPSMPEGMHSKVGPGSFYSFDNNTLPKMLSKKYDFPWESLPKDWTTSVKLREISKRRIREERNSSSGNWSGSSARHSLESERAKSIGALSQRSLGTDSGRESPTPTADETTTDTAGEAGDEGSVVTGEPGRSHVDGRTKSRLDTEAWLRSLSIRAAARDDSSSSSETIASLTKQNVASMEDFTGDILERYRLMDDDASSVYSLDQEGFYTSFHNDSGLRRSTTTLWEEEETATSPVDDKSCSVHSVSSNLSVDSVIYNPLTKTVPSPVIMRPPPKRQVSSGDSDGSAIFNLPAPTPQPSLNPTVDFSFSESDQELIYARVKQKTRISTTMYPSLCDVSSSDSDGEGSRSKTIGTDRLHQQKPLFDPESVQVVELSPGLKSSLGAVKVNDLHNGVDSKANSTSKILSTFSFSGSSDSSSFETTSKTVPVASVVLTRAETGTESDVESSKRPSFQHFSSLEGRSSGAKNQPKLKHSGSLDDSNLLGSSGEDKMKQVFHSLPRHYHVYKRHSYGPEYTNSWPRSHQSANHLSTMPQPATGILKSTQKPSNLPKTPKTLNFAPVVNMFDPGTPEAVQVLLTSSGESPVREVNRSKLPQTNSFTAPTDCPGKPTVKLENARPLSSGSESDVTNDGELPAKYRPTLIVRPGKRHSDPCSDVSPYATSPVSKTNTGRSFGSSGSGSETSDLETYRKSLVTSPTVDSGIGSVGDLSPSTPTSSVGAEEDFEGEESGKKATSPGQGSVFTGSIGQQKSQNPYASNQSYQVASSFGGSAAAPDLPKKAFGVDLITNGEELEYADDTSDDTLDTPTRQLHHQAPDPPSLSVSSDSFASGRSSFSDSKLMDRYNRNKAALPSHHSASVLPARSSSQSAGPYSTPTTVSPSTRTSSYRNACAASTRSSSYRVAQSSTAFGSKLAPRNPVPTVRSDSYRVACEDLVPPPIPEHQKILDAPRKSVDMTDSAARAESYRVAIEEMDDPEIFEYKPVNKRAAITSLDQLLPKPAGNGSKGLKSPKQIKRSITESGFFSRLMGKQDKSTSKLNGATASGPVKSSYVPLGLSDKQDSASKLKTPSSSYRVKQKSSTYVSFDVLSSVEEVKEDSMHGSVESVRAPSMSSLQSFQSGQSSNSFLKRESSPELDDQRPLVRRSQRQPVVKGVGRVVRPSSGDKRRSTGGTNSTARVVGGPHMTNGYAHLMNDPNMETGV